MTRLQLCEKFCEGLSDTEMEIALQNRVTAKRLWEERNQAFINLETRGFDPHEKRIVSVGHAHGKAYA